MKLDRRRFLIGLFGAAAVAKAGPISAAIEQLSDTKFKSAMEAAKALLPRDDEIYGNDKGDYAFAQIKWLNEPPYIKVIIPEGYRPLREESDRINAEIMAKLYEQR